MGSINDNFYGVRAAPNKGTISEIISVSHMDQYKSVCRRSVVIFVQESSIVRFLHFSGKSLINIFLSCQSTSWQKRINFISSCSALCTDIIENGNIPHNILVKHAH